ncbi:hypothetical protein [Micromonospora sp. ATCC 39149]|uniref:Uncharacterized protein n=1 Tax=Micromonospora carbonacea TaxID=47853 RepID=A0A7D6CD23_9ACTN|nr:hypothetical protein [Micromonospora sp. ATCC 39149]QLJ96789.1 hypothetical protein HZU44_17980 [Micromonospora carbonacea]
MSSRAGVLTGQRVYRIHWLPGTDTLRGVCHCGAERVAEEPVELWQWLLAHPQGHRAAAVPAPGPARRPAVRA